MACLGRLLLSAAASAEATRRVTISGQSSGGDMAAAHLVAYSASVDGAAIASGSPYGCDTQWFQSLRCAWGIPLKPNIRHAVEYVHDQFAQGCIDDPSNLSSTPVFLFHGKRDLIVSRGVMEAVHQQLEALVSEDKLLTKFDTEASHVWSIDHGRCECGHCIFANWSSRQTNTPCCDVENCGYDLTGAMFRHLLSDKIDVLPRTTKRSELHWIKQRPYIVGRLARTRTLTWAIAYVPTACEKRTGLCQVHVDYVGCEEDTMQARREWAINLDMHEYAEANNIIVVHPQTSGCWGKGYYYSYYGDEDMPWDSREGSGLCTVINMLEDLDNAIASAQVLPIDQLPDESVEMYYGQAPCTNPNFTDYTQEDVIQVHGATVCAAKCSSSNDCPGNRLVYNRPVCSPCGLPEGYCGLECNPDKDYSYSYYSPCPEGSQCVRNGLRPHGVCAFQSDAVEV